MSHHGQGGQVPRSPYERAIRGFGRVQGVEQGVETRVRLELRAGVLCFKGRERVLAERCVNLVLVSTIFITLIYRVLLALNLNSVFW